MSISSRIERVRTEDLLEEEQPTERAIRGGVGARRQLAGLAVGLLGLPLLTLVLERSSAALESVVLIYLLAVVVLAAIGGVLIAVLAAIAATLLMNYFFVAPVHTLDIEHGHQALALGVFLVVAIAVSGALDLATRRTRAAQHAAAQTEMLSGLAGGDIDETSSLREVIQRARDAFRMESVVLKVRERSDAPWVDVERSGWAPPGQEAPLQFDIPISRSLRLVGRGPALFAEDQRVLTAFAAAAQAAFETRQLSARAETATTLAETSRERTALLGAAGQELDAPVADIQAAIALLRDMPGQHEAALETIEASAHRLRRLGADLLDASRLQSGTLEVAMRPTALDAVVAAAVSSLPGAPQRVLSELPADLPAVTADPTLLERVIANLLDDELRSGAGQVRISVTAGASSARVEVAADAAGRRTTGSDLGLTVARGLTHAMGGALAHDAAGDGRTIVRLRFPLAAAGGHTPLTPG